MRYYPIAIDSQGKKALIVGGGKVGLQKLTSLLASEFSIHMIAKNFISTIENHPCRSIADQISENSKTHEFTIEHCCLQDPLDEKLLDTVDFLVIATDDPKLNDSLAMMAQKQGVLFVRCDKRVDGSCLLQSVLSKGELTVAIGTQGKSPATSRIVRMNLEEYLDQDFEEKIKLLDQLKQILIKKKINKDEMKQVIAAGAKKSLVDLQIHVAQMEEKDGF